MAWEQALAAPSPLGRPGDKAETAIHTTHTHKHTNTYHTQGEYIAPEKIENMYATSSYVAQVYLYGDSLKASVVAIIVPDEEVVMKWAKDNGKEGNFQDLCKSQVS